MTSLNQRSCLLVCQNTHLWFVMHDLLFSSSLSLLPLTPPPLLPLSSHLLLTSPFFPLFLSFPLTAAAQFLHDNGVLLHYNDHLRGLNNLYFIDPIWLADMLAEVITVPEKQAFVQNGILKDSSVAFIFRDSKRFPSQFFQQYLQLLERFEIALSLGNGQRLIPSMLPVHKPDLNLPELSPSTTSKAQTVSCIRRRYKMSYIPSGFWSRLISRLIINLKRSGLMEDNQPTESNLTYWRRGILVNHASGRFLVESAQPLTSG